MGKKVMKLFLDTMLRAAVIILAVAIVVMLVLLARTVSKSKKSDASDTGNKTSIVTEESDPSDPTFGGSGDAADSSDTSADDSSQDASTDDANAGNGKDAKVVVLNASGVSGVAATWQTTLTADGYTSVDIGTYDNGDQSTTVIYTSDSYDVSGLVSLLGGAATADRSDIDSSVASDVDISGADICRSNRCGQRSQQLDIEEYVENI